MLRLVSVLLAYVVVFSQSVAADSSVSDIRTEKVTYHLQGKAFHGFYAYDAAINGKRPGVLVVHEWWGQNDYARQRAEDLAKAGYAAFALDMYGEGRVASHPDEAQAFMKATFAKAETVPMRFDAAFSWLQQQPQVLNDKIAAIGYCYGGGVVLGMARAGKDLDAVVSFHGSLATQTPAITGRVKAKVAVFTGAKDPMVPVEQVQGFEKEMRAAGVSYTLKSYPNARHSFTNPAANAVAENTDLPVGYDAEADADSWQGMLEIFNQVF